MANDARVRYTKMVIEKSFVKLIKAKPVQRITVKELCEEAEINRATFYRYYLDVFDLLEKTEEQFLSQLEKVLTDKKDSTIKELLTFIMVSIKAEEDTYKAVCSPNGDPSFTARVFDECYHMSLPQQNNDSEKTSPAENKWLYQYIAHGCNGILASWIADGMKEPISQVADFMDKLAGKTMS